MTTNDTWSPAQYDKFQREREQPFFDLLDMIQRRAKMRVVDLGCGTGRLTRVLHERLDARETIGIDRSPNMLSGQGQQPLPQGLSFEVDTIESFPGHRGAFDLIFSNAAFHWLQDHDLLLGCLTSALTPGGQLAFQVPSSHDDASHIVADEVAEMAPYREALGGWRRPRPVLAPEGYARTLHRLGFANPRVHLIVYPHVLPGPESVVEWVKGTLLTDYAQHLSPELFEAFVKDYRARLIARLDRIDPSRPLFFPFKRILCWGQRA